MVKSISLRETQTCNTVRVSRALHECGCASASFLQRSQQTDTTNFCRASIVASKKTGLGDSKPIFIDNCQWHSQPTRANGPFLYMHCVSTQVVASQSDCELALNHQISTRQLLADFREPEKFSFSKLRTLKWNNPEHNLKLSSILHSWHSAL